MPQAVQRGAPLRRRRKLCFWTACFCNPSVFAVTAPLPKKSLLCKSFSGARNSPLFLISVGFSCGACACLGARERSERVTGRRQPPRQLRRRLVQDKHTPCCHTRKFSVSKRYISGYIVSRSYSGYAICEGFDISLEEFFASPLFDRKTLHD